MPFVNFADLCESMTGPELDAAFQAVMWHIEDDDLRQALLVLEPGQRRTLRALLDSVEAQVVEIDQAVAHGRDIIGGRQINGPGPDHPVRFPVCGYQVWARTATHAVEVYDRWAALHNQEGS